MTSRSLRPLGLASTALAALVLALPAAASTCVEVIDGLGNPTLTCAGTGSDRVNDARDDLTVIITETGELVRGNGRAVTVNGDRVSVENAGLIQSGGDNDGIRSAGTGLTVDNFGQIIGTARGIRVNGGIGDFTLRNHVSGTIESVQQGVRLDQTVLPENNLIENWGIITSTAGRAIQSRGTNTTVINHETGVLRGFEEVVEGRLGFTLENRGFIGVIGLDIDPDTLAWTDSGARPDEDGVQFSSGRVDNWGIILGTDDGIDIDEGVIHNHRTGVIISAGPDDELDRAVVDIDEALQIPLPGGDETFEPAGKVTILNEGYMEGPRAINADANAVQPIHIENSGTMIGRSGIAIDLAPGQGDTTIALSGASVVKGDILFGGGGTNTLILGPFEAGAQMEGSISAKPAPEDPFAVLASFATFSSFPGTLGAFDVVFDDGVGISDFLGYLFRGDHFALQMRAGDGSVRFDLFGVQSFSLERMTYSPESFASFLSANNVGVIPLPAPLWLLLGGLGMLAAVHRRRAA